MKTLQYIFTGTLLLIAQLIFAQTSNIVVFSEDADKFYILVNGVHQNAEAKSNVKLTGLQAETAYKIKVVFQDNTLPGLEKAVYPESGVEYSFNIKRSKKGVLKMTPFGFSEINNNSTASPGQYVVQYGSDGGQPVQNGSVVTNTNTNTNSNTDVNVNTTTTTTATTATTTTNEHNNNATVNVNTNVNDANTNVNTNATITENPNGVDMNTTVGDGTNSVSMNVTITENGMNVNINENGNVTDANATINTNIQATDPNINTNTNTTYTETTTVTSTTTVNGQVTDHYENTTTNTNGNVNSNTTTINNTTNTNNPTIAANNGPCYAMSAADYKAAVQSIESKDFEDSKLKIAKQVIDKNCMDAAQIKGIMETFDFEATRLTFAKHAYSHCSDPQNYFKVNDVFDFESSIEELDGFIQGK